MKKLIEPQTKRLKLRCWRASDRAPFAALNGDAEVMAFFPTTLEHSQSNSLADRLERNIKESGWGIWALELKGGADFIGCVGLQEVSSQLPIAPCIEVGWRLNKPFWGNGYATEAAIAALEVGFKWLKLDEIVAFTSQLNVRSRAVMDRLGMVEDAEGFDHPAVPEGNPLRHHRLYRLSRSNWLTAGSMRNRPDANR